MKTNFFCSKFHSRAWLWLGLSVWSLTFFSFSALAAETAAKTTPSTDRSTPLSEKIESVTQITYLPEAGAFGIGDLYLPRSWNSETPLALVIHGGGWSAMDRFSSSGIAEFLCENGFAVLNAEYRLTCDVPWPQCGDDCLAAARFLLDGANETLAKLNRAKVFVIGGSAGGHLALMTGLRLPPERVSGIVSISGIADMKEDFRANPGRYQAFFRHEPTDEEMIAASPMGFITEKVPPMLLTHTIYDSVVPFSSARNFVEACQKAGFGDRVRLYDYERKNDGHCIWRPGSRPHRLHEDLEYEIIKFASLHAPVSAVQPTEEGGIRLVRNGQTLWEFHPNGPEGKPFIAPLRLPSGQDVAFLRPQDHTWHLGVWFSWKFLNGVNYWEPSDGETVVDFCEFGETDPKKFSWGADVARLQLTYRDRRSPDETVLSEEREIRFSQPDSNGGFVIESHHWFKAGAKDVVVDRTPPHPKGGGYAGLGIRLIHGISGFECLCENSETEMLTIREKPASWVEYRDAQSGNFLRVTVLKGPETSRFYAQKSPTYCFINPCPVLTAPLTIKAGETLELHYQIQVGKH